jgi:hypothetical protein
MTTGIQTINPTSYQHVSVMGGMILIFNSVTNNGLVVNQTKLFLGRHRARNSPA